MISSTAVCVAPVCVCSVVMVTDLGRVDVVGDVCARLVVQRAARGTQQAARAGALVTRVAWHAPGWFSPHHRNSSAHLILAQKK